MPWQYPAGQAAESDSSLHEAQQAHSFHAPRQLPASHVTGNPFAEPEDLNRPATSLLSHQHESIEHGWDAQAPSYARPSSRAQSVDQPQVDFYAEAQQAIPDSDFKHESAWDATQVAQGPAYNSDEASQVSSVCRYWCKSHVIVITFTMTAYYLEVWLTSQD